MRNKTRIRCEQIVIILSRYKLFYRIFAFVYKLSLRLIVFVFKNQSGITAVILRRKNVLFDLYPGDSDYDITCVFKAKKDNTYKALSGYSKMHKCIKITCPMLGETKFIKEEDLSSHFKYNLIGYCGSPFFLYRKNSYAPLKLNSHSNIGAYQLASSILINRIWREILQTPASSPDAKNITFSRNVYKVNKKIKWLANTISLAHPPELDYCNEKANLLCSAKTRYSMLQEALDVIKTKIAVKANLANFCFDVEGTNELVPEKDLNDMRAIISPLISAGAGQLEEISLCNYRLYKNCKMLLVKCKKDIDIINTKGFISRIKKCSDKLRPYYTVLITEYPICLDRILWDFVMSAEPITKILYEHEHYDFLKRERACLSQHNAAINKEYLYADMANAIDMIHSMARGENTLYLLDLLFGHLIAYNLLLTDKILFASFDRLREYYLNNLGLNKVQHEIIDMYRLGTYRKIKKIKTMRIWQIFNGLILYETDRARDLSNANV